MVKKIRGKKYFEHAVILTETDFENAQKVYEEQSISPVDESNIFRGGLYCILSAAQDYTNHVKIYNQLIKNGLDTPENILQSKPKLKRIIKGTRFPNMKYGRVCDFSEWWPKSEMAEKIMADIGNNRLEEYPIREQITEEAPGMSRKCTSLLLNKLGYENVVPIDLWVLRALSSWGYDVKISDYTTVSGLTKKEYLSYEDVFSDYAKKLNVSPAKLQAAIWAKYSLWKDNTKNMTLNKYY